MPPNPDQDLTHPGPLLLPSGFDHGAAPGMPRLGQTGPAFSQLIDVTQYGQPDAVRPSTDTGLDLAAFTGPRAPFPGVVPGRTAVMAILNVTPDSFSDGGRFSGAQAAIEEGLRLAEAGADVLDVGGESTPPGASPVPEEEELDRVLPVIEGLVARCPVPVSIDTRKARVMAESVAAGAQIVNDVSALTYDPASLETVAGLNCSIILMHAQGEPQTMQQAPTYGHVLADVYHHLAARIGTCAAAGITLERLMVDPGIGFGKTLDHNLALLNGQALFHGLGTPVLLGASRKSFVGRIEGAGGKSADTRLAGSLAAACLAAEMGIQMVRVHDVSETVQALAVWRAMRSAGFAGKGAQAV